jgi:hypothetical protein
MNTFHEGESLYWTIRPTGPDNLPVLLGTPIASNPGPTTTVTSWSLYLYDEDSATPTATVYELLDQNPQGSFFTSLVLDTYWGDLDEKGYSARFTVPGSGFTSVGGHTYRLELVITTPNFGLLVEQELIQCVGRYSA